MASIYDVARTAGVSPKTVARALNGDAPVKAETRKRVEQAVRALGYVPSQAARSMRNNRSGLVGLVSGAVSGTPREVGEKGLPDIFIVQGIQRGLADANVTLLISDTGGRPDKVPALFRTLFEHRVQGLFYVAPHHQEIVLPAHPPGTPVVLVNCFDGSGAPAILPDDEGGQFALVERLIAFGHRRIGYLTLPHHMIANTLRIAGYKRALAAAGLPFDPGLVQLGDGDGHEENAVLAAALDHLLALKDRPSVLCFGNDRLALKAYGMLRARGLRIPEDIGVAGFDDYRVISETLYPPLTTVDLPYAAMGERAAKRLLSLIHGSEEDSAPPTEIVGCAVEWRQSVQSRDLKIKALKGAK